MADTKITALTALTAADPANDVIPIVDVSDTSMAASGTTKKISVNNILGASGTATLASATITGAATVGTTLGVTGVSTLASAVVTGALTSGTTTLVSHAAGYTGKVGIGTATPNNTLTINGTAATWTKGAYIIYSDAGSTYIGGLGNGGNIFGSGTDNDIGITTGGATNLRLGTNNTERMRIDSSGNVSIANGNLVMSTSGKGIDFSATSSNGTSELLNDYEEGTWVPTVGGTSTYTGQTGSYIKVGRLVTVSFDMAILLLGTGSTTTMSGLPFVVGSTTSPKCEQCHGAAGYVQSLAVNVYSLTFNANANTSVINSVSMNTLGGTANVNPAIYGNGTRVQGTVTYMTTA